VYIPRHKSCYTFMMLHMPTQLRFLGVLAVFVSCSTSGPGGESSSGGSSGQNTSGSSSGQGSSGNSSGGTSSGSASGGEDDGGLPQGDAATPPLQNRTTQTRLAGLAVASFDSATQTLGTTALREPFHPARLRTATEVLATFMLIAMFECQARR
jgi:hypothetical protein